jgi:hypothetical protein
MNTKDEKLLKLFHGLSKIGQDTLLSQMDLALIEAQAVREQYGLPLNREPPAGKRSA